MFAWNDAAIVRRAEFFRSSRLEVVFAQRHRHHCTLSTVGNRAFLVAVSRVSNERTHPPVYAPTQRVFCSRLYTRIHDFSTSDTCLCLHRTLYVWSLLLLSCLLWAPLRYIAISASSQRLIVRQTRLKQLATSPAALPLLAYRVAPKTGPLCFVRLNFFYNLTPFWNLFHCQNQEIILSLTITPHLKCVNWKQDDVCNNTFKSASSTARRTHWTFDVITAGCDSYLR